MATSDAGTGDAADGLYSTFDCQIVLTDEDISSSAGTRTGIGKVRKIAIFRTTCDTD